MAIPTERNLHILAETMVEMSNQKPLNAMDMLAKACATERAFAEFICEKANVSHHTFNASDKSIFKAFQAIGGHEKHSSFRHLFGCVHKILKCGYTVSNCKTRAHQREFKKAECMIQLAGLSLPKSR